MFFIEFFENLVKCNVTKKENNIAENDCLEGYIPYLKECCNKEKYNNARIISRKPETLNNKEKNLQNIFHSSKEQNIDNIRCEIEDKMIFKQKKNIKNSRIPI